MAGITTHVLDTSRGKPAAGVPIVLESQAPSGEHREIGRGVTDTDGRLRTLVPEGVVLRAGVYRLTFDTAAYFAALGGAGSDAFYPSVSVSFVVRAPGDHYHVPLLLSPFGYSTYRGS